MRKLCVFDLDGTLIPYDSFSRIVRPLLFRRPALLLQAILRRAELISRATFAERSHLALRSVAQEQGRLESIAAAIINDVSAERLGLIGAWRERGGYLVLLSASPDDYVRLVAERLGFDAGFGSHWEAGRYRHLHGEEKRRFIDERYPAADWERAFAIADHDSDGPLLSEFRQSQRIRAR